MVSVRPSLLSVQLHLWSSSLSNCSFIRPAQILPCNFRPKLRGMGGSMSMFNWLRFAIRMQFVLKMQSHHNISASLPRLDCPITPIRRLRLQDSSFGAFLQLCALFASKEKIINDSTGSNLIWWAKTGPKLVLVLSVSVCSVRSYYYYCTLFPLWPLGWLFTRLWSDPCLMCPLVSGDQCTMGNFGSPGRHFRRS